MVELPEDGVDVVEDEGNEKGDNSVCEDVLNSEKLAGGTALVWHWMVVMTSIRSW
jgi:hypothetical protein